MESVEDLQRCITTESDMGGKHELTSLASSGGEEGPAKTEETPAVIVKEKKKAAKKVMKRVSLEHVAFVLAAKPTLRSRLPPELQPRHITEERRRQSARVDEIINSINELRCSIQNKYRHELATKGYVEVEVEVTDDEA